MIDTNTYYEIHSGGSHALDGPDAFVSPLDVWLATAVPDWDDVELHTIEVEGDQVGVTTVDVDRFVDVHYADLETAPEAIKVFGPGDEVPPLDEVRRWVEDTGEAK